MEDGGVKGNDKAVLATKQGGDGADVPLGQQLPCLRGSEGAGIGCGGGITAWKGGDEEGDGADVPLGQQLPCLGVGEQQGCDAGREGKET